MSADLSDLPDEVIAGIGWLDEHIPEWLAIIDVDKLKLESYCNCVLGQLVCFLDSTEDIGVRPSRAFSAFSALAREDRFGEEFVDGFLLDAALGRGWQLEPKVLTLDEARALGFHTGGETSTGWERLTDGWKAAIDLLREDRGVEYER